MSARTSGFTLFEVLVAVAVLGILYTVLARVAIQGLQAEGDSERRLRASLLADETLVEIEGQTLLGFPPAVGRDESEEGEFRVTTEVTPLEIALPEPELPTGRGTVPGTSEDLAVSLLTARDSRGQPALRRIDVQVAWREGQTERSVERVTYALDRGIAGNALRELGLQGDDGTTDDAAALPEGSGS